MPAATPGVHAWSDARRLEAWAGETRVNLVRAGAIAAFFTYHLLNVYAFRDDPDAAGRFHLAATSLTVSWSILAFVLYVCLSARWVPPWLKYAATSGDLALLTLLLAQAGGPKSP